MKKSNISRMGAAVAGFAATLLCMAFAPTLPAQLPATGNANQNPFLDENSGEELGHAIVKYPYSWEHGDSSQTMKFNADGSANGLDSSGKLYWHQRNAQEIDLWHADSPAKKIILKFSKDFTVYGGVDFDGKRLTGKQIMPNSQASQAPAGAPAIELADPATIEMLTSGDWTITGKNWSNVYTFKRDHTVVENEHPAKDPITWEISDNKLIIHFSSHGLVLQLPLNPKGTRGYDTASNDKLTATRMEVGAKPQ